jgi:hypothetical protein
MEDQKGYLSSAFRDKDKGRQENIKEIHTEEDEAESFSVIDVDFVCTNCH